MKTRKSIGILLMVIALVSGLQVAAQRRPAMFNHMALYVVDLEKSTVFYRDVLQIDTIPEPFHDGKHAWFKIGQSGQLHIISGAQKASIHEKNNHLCFSVHSMDEMIARLNKYKIDFENLKGDSKVPTTRVDGIKQIYLKDPDGYWVEINNDYR